MIWKCRKINGSAYILPTDDETMVLEEKESTEGKS